jgi:hypothetical protein
MVGGAVVVGDGQTLREDVRINGRVDPYMLRLETSGLTG